MGREPRQRKPLSGEQRIGLVVLVALLTIPLWLGPVVRWYECQQLAPIERFVTRGC